MDPDSAVDVVADVSLPAGLTRGVSSDMLVNGADVGYKAASLWVLDHGVDMDEIVDPIDMSSLPAISESGKESLQESLNRS